MAIHSEWLRNNWEQFKQFIPRGGYVPADVAMAIWISAKGETVDCIRGDSTKITKSFLDKYDVVYVIYDYTEIFGEAGSIEKVNRLRLALGKTRAFVFPYPNYHDFILTKSKYYADINHYDFCLVEEGYTGKTPKEIKHDYLIKDFVNFDKIINKYL